ncbi:unnamed protein product, partial [Polarella glacialis]
MTSSSSSPSVTAGEAVDSFRPFMHWIDHGDREADDAASQNSSPALSGMTGLNVRFEPSAKKPLVVLDLGHCAEVDDSDGTIAPFSNELGEAMRAEDFGDFAEVLLLCHARFANRIRSLHLPLSAGVYFDPRNDIYDELYNIGIAALVYDMRCGYIEKRDLILALKRTNSTSSNLVVIIQGPLESQSGVQTAQVAMLLQALLEVLEPPTWSKVVLAFDPRPAFQLPAAVPEPLAPARANAQLMALRCLLWSTAETALSGGLRVLLVHHDKIQPDADEIRAIPSADGFWFMRPSIGALNSTCRAFKEELRQE